MARHPRRRTGAGALSPTVIQVAHGIAIRELTYWLSDEFSTAVPPISSPPEIPSCSPSIFNHGVEDRPIVDTRVDPASRDPLDLKDRTTSDDVLSCLSHTHHCFANGAGGVLKQKY
jgi:hypothetical protein